MCAVTERLAELAEDEYVADIVPHGPVFEDPINLWVVIEVPKIEEAKEEKLTKVLKKIFENVADREKNEPRCIIENILYPKNQGEDKSLGFAFASLGSLAQVEVAIRRVNGFQLDKKNVLKVYRFGEAEALASMSEEYKKPERQPYREVNLQEWLLDADCIDQFVMKHHNRTSLYNNYKEEPAVCHFKENWTESYTAWSPNGTYMATFHAKGIALWGGTQWQQLQRFEHRGVKLIAFSNTERYLVTWSNEVQENKEDPNRIIIWDVKTGQKVRGFLEHEQGKQVDWPVIRWSHDDKMFARLSDKGDGISVYEAPSMKMLDKKSIKIEEVKDFQWSPTDHILCFWQPEIVNNPARVTLMKMPEREELRCKNLYNVSSCNLHWQKSGDHLCVKVDRHTKTKKTIFTNFELFRIREKAIPVDSLEIKDPIIAFAWEPHGTKFSIILGEQPRISVSVYRMEDAKSGGKVILAKAMEKKSVNHIFWSPNGRFMVLAGLRNMSGTLEFWDTEDMTLMNESEHFMCTDVEWDPTGRYVATSVSYWRHQMENGFIMWNFQGKQIVKKQVEKLCQMLWRPRPPTPLSPEQLKQVKKNLKQYSLRFDKIDSLVDQSASKELVEKRRSLMEHFDQFRTAFAEKYAANKQRLVEMMGGVDDDDMSLYVETDVDVEVTVSNVVKIIGGKGK